ncbi:MAG: GerMN domain-containing protein [Defluviitaleaceae bacterium]|nr:GerMN domain-containing protein [Defluviitaleaceae bacterium]MCL2238626.1 GerMN domain-containing protein [Defluviitaleaceae bacterium]
MKNLFRYHWRKLIPFALIIVLIPVAIAVSLMVHSRYAGVSGGLRVFYFNPAVGRLESVAMAVPAGTPQSQIEAMLGRFYTPPPSLEGLWPLELGLVDITLDGDRVGIALPPDFRDMTAFAQTKLRSGLTLTLTELPFVQEVLFWVHGEGEKPAMHFAEWIRHEEYWDMGAVRIESPATVENNPTISPGMMAARTITLYFVCIDGEGLVTETFIDDYVDMHRLTEFKLEYLIAGPVRENAMHIIPPETRIRSVIADRPTNSIYVDFSGDFLSRFAGNWRLAQLMLQSVVNTLTLPGNNDFPFHRVFFLVDSERIDVFHGVGSFDSAFTYDHEMILVEEDPYDPYYDPYEYEEEDVPVGPRGEDEE